jgi:nitrite reductase/ring-hydroxylating ferredoxin subunit
MILRSLMMAEQQLVRAARLDDIQGCTTVQLNGHTIALFRQGDDVYAVDNRCPHMGFPLDRGTVGDGILTCHWHHARFDLQSGGAFDLFADDVPAYPVEIQDGEVWVDLAEHRDKRAHQRDRLRVGLERSLSLVVGKAVLVLLADDGDPVEPFLAGLKFGARYREAGWGQGLTILSCMMRILPCLDKAERPRALYQGLAAVANEAAGDPPRFPVDPLPDTTDADIPTLKRWFRQFIEVRDDEGAERCIISAVRAGATVEQMADMLFASVTDHRYIQIGHPADFTNKAFEALEIVGWEHAEAVLTSLVRNYAVADRMEESNAWRHPIDIVALLEATFEKLPDALATGEQSGAQWDGRTDLVKILLEDDPRATVQAMLDALAAGCTMIELASAVSYAAARRIAHFHTSNEFGDWDTALHTFTFANAIEEGLRRAPSIELLRGVFDAAMSVYLDRFLNIPAARLPNGDSGDGADAAILLNGFPNLLDRQQQVNQAGERVAGILHNGGDADELMAMLGKLLLREDRDFHTIQTVEAAFNQFKRLRGTDEGVHVLVAAARYLAAHSPTVRAQGQRFEIAQRLHRGERIFEGE